MSHHETLARILRTGILPVIRARSADEALRLVDAVRAGGIDVIELTMSVPGAVEVIRELTQRFGDDVLVGAGTVLDAETARACMLAGARFVVSPALDLATIACCRTYAVPVMPGALTPTEIVAAWKAGASMVKVFPCGAVGGATYVKSLKAPLPQIDLVPTGGVTVANVEDYFKAGASAVGAGADLVAGAPAEVTAKAREYVLAVARARAAGGAR